MKTKKGMTIVELLLSIILISLVLIFIIQLCLRTRNAYLNNSISVKYELSKSIIIDSVMTDFIKKGITGITRRGNNIQFTYENGITKTLTVTSSTGTILVKYSGGTDPTVAREYKAEEVNFQGIDEQNVNSGDNHLKVFHIKLKGNDGYDYTINLYCPY